MPSTMLFAVNTEGRLFGLSTTGTKWKEFPYHGVEFKQISAVPNFLWAVGGDRQIYLHAHGLDIPIRVKEELYENERWFPVEGFGKRLLPTDRYHWSTKDGQTERRKEQVRLPSMAWQWEGEWQLELTLDGQPLDYDGWTYALDFRSSYVATKQWTSCIRRRKWYRYRHYAAMYTWCAISPLNKDPTQEPFIHIAVGGHKQVNENKGALLVWAVTAHGRVMFRNGVCFECPEGTRWSNVSIPQEVEVKSISCGPTGLVWVVLWDGRALVRYGISSYTPTGEKWLEVLSPVSDVKLTQLSVGTNSVWAITSDNRVWFRKCIEGFPTEETARGTGWIEMSDKMTYVTTSPNDQLWAIDEINRKIHYRYGIDENELTGRKWMQIRSPRQLTGKAKKSVDSGNSSMTYDSFDVCSNSVTFGSNSYPQKNPSVISKSIVRSWSPIRSAGSVLGVEANPDTDDTCLDLDKEKEVFMEKEDLTQICESDEMHWSCVEAGAVHFNSPFLPKWFINDWKEQTKESPWRASILKDLKARNVLEQNGFKEYEPSEQINYWTKSVCCKYLGEKKKLTEEAILQIELTVQNNDTTDKGMLLILSSDEKQVKCQMKLEEIVCIMDSSVPSSPCITLHTKISLHPIKVFISSENDFHDWISSLSSVCCRVNKVNGLPEATSLWSVTECGHIYVLDSGQFGKNKITEDGKYYTDLKVKGHKLPFEIKFLNEFSVGSELTIDASIVDNSDRFAIDLISCLNGDIAFHFNPRFNDGIIVRNSKLNNKWGLEERKGKLSIKTNTNFTLTIVCLENYYKVYINASPYTCYDHRVSPCYVTSFRISGDIILHHAIYETVKKTIPLDGIFLRRIDGHLCKIQSSCVEGVVWGLTFDHTLWCLVPDAFNSNFNGSPRVMTDAKEIFIYENQRWNPLKGFVDIMLPTDRYKWSDETGKIKMTKDSVKLQNMHWKWICDWQIDYKAEGGADKDGWQYAKDFRRSYHPNKTIADTVRRRRWVRRCKLTINAPWEEIGSTKLLDIALHGKSKNGKISGWGVTVKGDVLFRSGVTADCCTGESWVYIQSEEPMTSISCNGLSRVWCCGVSGTTYWRLGTTENNPAGDSWVYVEPPTGVKLKYVCVAQYSIWALDGHGNIFVRMDVTSLFPGETTWNQLVDTCKFKKISACGTSIWAINESGLVCRRVGVAEDNPKGLHWVYGLPGNWRDTSE